METPDVDSSKQIKKLREDRLEKNDEPKKGRPAILSMDDSIPEGFFDKVKNFNPDGYIVGVGIGGILTFINTFPPNTLPKGIYIADVEPQVVVAAKLFIEELSQADNFDDLYQNYFTLDETRYKAKFDNILEENPSLKAANEGRSILYTPKQAWDESLNTNITPYSIPVVVRNNFETLQKLARNGSFTVEHTDITNPAFIDKIITLPGFSTSTNIIYTSNMSDFIQDSTRNNSLQNLKKLHEASSSSIFVYSLTEDGQQLNVTHSPNLN